MHPRIHGLLHNLNAAVFGAKQAIEIQETQAATFLLQRVQRIAGEIIEGGLNWRSSGGDQDNCNEGVGEPTP